MLRKLWPGIFSTTFTLGLLLTTTGLRAQERASAEALTAINDAIAEVRAEIGRRNNEHDRVYQTLQDSEKVLASLAGEITSLERAINGNEEDLVELRRQEAGLQSHKSQQQVLIKQYVRSAYQNSRQEYYKLLLNQEDPARLSRMLGYYRYFSTARSQMISKYNATLVELQTLASRINATNSTLQHQRQDMAVQQAKLQNSQRERQDLLDEIDVMVSTSAGKLATLEAEREEMELLIEELRRSIANLTPGDKQQPFASLRGRLPWPVDGALRNSWGASYGLGDLSWEGVTIAADSGTDVRAIHDGRVVFSDWFSASGLLLIIDHGDGYMSIYAHNQALFRDVGEWVNGGEIIAAVGNTGGQGKPGLYFEIRHNGSSENPSAWCMASN
jgi:septal ring factor EnvC (AmiA/AmiB activator)